MTNSDLIDMEQKETLMSLDWNTFARYPEQGANIWLHCFTAGRTIHRFIKIENFNSACLDVGQIIQDLPSNHKWMFSWLPVNLVDEVLSSITRHNSDENNEQ